MRMPFGGSTRIAAGVAALVLLSACVSHRRSLVPPDGIDAREHSLPDGAKVGMSIAWREEKPEPEADDVVRRERACVAETADSITLETRTTDRVGHRVVVATRHARDGRILAAWRGEPGGVGLPVKVIETDPVDWEAQGSRAEEMRLRYGIPEPAVSTGNAREVLETPAGKIPCTRETIKVSILWAGVTTTIWRSESKLPLTNGDLVRLTRDGLGGPRGTTLVAYSWKGAEPTLTIPP